MFFDANPRLHPRPDVPLHACLEGAGHGADQAGRAQASAVAHASTSVAGDASGEGAGTLAGAAARRAVLRAKGKVQKTQSKKLEPASSHLVRFPWQTV